MAIMPRKARSADSHACATVWQPKAVQRQAVAVAAEEVKVEKTPKVTQARKKETV